MRAEWVRGMWEEAMFLFSNSYCLKNIVPLDYLYLHLNVHGTYYIQRTSSFFIQHRTLKFLWLFHHHDSNSEKRDASVFREWTESSVQCHAISYRPLLLMLVELSSDGSLVACSVRHGLENWYPSLLCMSWAGELVSWVLLCCFSMEV